MPAGTACGGGAYRFRTIISIILVRVLQGLIKRGFLIIRNSDALAHGAHLAPQENSEHHEHHQPPHLAKRLSPIFIYGLVKDLWSDDGHTLSITANILPGDLIDGLDTFIGGMPGTGKTKCNGSNEHYSDACPSGITRTSNIRMIMKRLQRPTSTFSSPRSVTTQALHDDSLVRLLASGVTSMILEAPVRISLGQPWNAPDPVASGGTCQGMSEGPGYWGMCKRRALRTATPAPGPTV